MTTGWPPATVISDGSYRATARYPAWQLDAARDDRLLELADPVQLLPQLAGQEAGPLGPLGLDRRLEGGQQEEEEVPPAVADDVRPQALLEVLGQADDLLGPAAEDDRQVRGPGPQGQEGG